MCLKTLFLQVAKLLPLSIDIQRALETDETSRDYRAGIGDALDLQPRRAGVNL
jgi:recombinational DNA repair protein RecT